MENKNNNPIQNYPRIPNMKQYLTIIVVKHSLKTSFLNLGNEEGIQGLEFFQYFFVDVIKGEKLNFRWSEDFVKKNMSK